MPKPIQRILSVVSALLVILGVLAALDVQRGPSADTVLERARAYVAEHPSVRFSGTMKVVIKAKDSEVGEESSTTTRIKGEIESKGRAHAVVSAGKDGVSEVVALGAVIYVRVAETLGAVRNAKYAKFDTSTARGAGVQYDTNQVKDLDLGAALAAARNPTKLRHNGKLTTIEADVNVTKLVGEVLAHDIEEIKLRLVVHKSGEVRSAVQLTGAQGAVITTDVSYTDWGSTIAIAEPQAGEIDPTPGIEEEKISAWEDAPLVMPKAIPAGWELSYADILSADETTEGCAEVEIDYEDVEDPDASYLYLYEFPNSCAKPFGGEGVFPFTAGPYRGFGKTSPEEGSLVQITVGGTTLQADSDLTIAELARVLSNLVPLNLSAKPGQIAGIGGRGTSV
jgi:hypothetical protein